MKNNKYHTVDGKVPKSNRKIMEGSQIDAQDKIKIKTLIIWFD